MLTTIRTRMQARRERHAARDRYDKAAELAGSLLWAFDYSDRKERISNLSVLVLTIGDMARECLIFDDDRYTEDGYTPYEHHLNEASLFLLVLAAEENDYSQIEDDEVTDNLYRDPQVQYLLGMLTDLGDEMEHKANVLLRLYNTVTPDVGSLASEGIAALAHVYLTSTGMTGREAHAVLWGTKEKAA